MEWYEIVSCVLWIILVIAAFVIVVCQVCDEIKTEKEAKLKSELQKSYANYSICDACGEHHQQPNSQICKDCERKANEFRYRK